MIPASTRRLRRRSAIGRTVAALDIGTHKIACLVAEIEAGDGAGGKPRPPRILGVGYQQSAGIERGAVVDLALAQEAVSATLAQAEQSSGCRIDEVILGVTGGGQTSTTFDGRVELAEGVVKPADIQRLEDGARMYATRDRQALLMLNRIAYGLDAHPIVRDPTNLAGRLLRANHHAVVADPDLVRNLYLLVESCQVEIAAVLPAGVASALAVTDEAQRQGSVVCLELGAGVTSITGIADSHVVLVSTLPFGGQHVTRELARYLAQPLAEAERIKTLYGSLIRDSIDEHTTVALRSCGAGPSATKADIGRVAVAGVLSLLNGAQQALAASPVERLRTARIVLTGGVSETLGLEGIAMDVLGRTVTIPAPRRLAGSGGRSLGSPDSLAFACAIGLVLAAAGESRWLDEQPMAPARGHGYLGRLGHWLKESF